MDLFIDPDGDGTITGSLFAQLRGAIESGRLAAGDRLPPTRQVADELGISRHTVTTVYGRLVAEGYTDGRAGAGSYVTSMVAPTPTTPTKPTALAAVVEPEPWYSEPLAAPRVRFDLRSGTPDLGLFPIVDWRRCMTTALQTPPVGYDHPAGAESLRRALARWIGVSRAVEASAEQVIVTSGAQHAIDLITRLLVRPGDVIAVEDPGYPPVTRLFRALGADVAPVPVDAEGIVVDRIPHNVRLIYTTPSHQSPTGVTMSFARRRDLLQCANNHDVAIIEDDYDSEYRHVDRPLEPLFRLDQHGRVIYIGTFSKTLAPSLRLGFVVLPPSLTAPARNLRALIDRQPPAAMQDALTNFIVHGHLRRHLKRTRKIYSERHRIVTDFTDRMTTAGLFADVPLSNAGLHVAALLPAGTDDRELRSRSSAGGIVIGNWGECWQHPNPPPGLIIGFGGVQAAHLSDALGELEEYISAASRGPGLPHRPSLGRF
ncbi:MAG: PLP-dependent aminotransferase family protein [Acidimicrobiales bacterium]|nr:PLP-dependent aminotransferase family protein [Acidimicrobiales bacterium]